MIVKFLGNKGGGSAGATIDYLLGKDRDREGAILLSGDPDLTARIADNLDFQNRYTVGVLSFEEKNLEAYQKQEIMQGFEKTLLAGLDRDQYDITWIEHTDKGRLELNFVIPNVELSTGKRLQPYFDKADRPLVENWKQVTNFEYGLSDPHAPDKAQAIKTLNSQNLPENVKEIKQHIGTAIAEQISNGNIQNRKDVITMLENAGFEITRQTERSISIKNPDGLRNIRLEGLIYENRQFGQQFAEEHSRARQDYQGTSRERYETALGKLHSLVESKQQGNSERFTSQFTDNSKSTREDQNRLTFEYAYRSNSRTTDNHIPNTVREQFLARESDQGKEQRTDGNYKKNRENSNGTEDFEQNRVPRGQTFDLFEDKNKSENRFSSKFGGASYVEMGKIKSDFNNPFENRFNQLNHGIELLRDSGNLFTNLPSHKQKIKSVDNQSSTLEKENAKRFHESLQRVIRIIRESIEQAERDKSRKDRADRNIEYSESSIETTERRLEESKSAVNQSEQKIKDYESRLIIENDNQKNQDKNNKRDKNFGMDR